MNKASPALPSTAEPISMRDKVLSKIAYVALALSAIAVGILIYWASANTKVLDIHNAPFPVRTIREHPTAGGVIILKVDYCKTRDINGSLRMSFVSPSREIFLPVTTERGPKGCNKTEVPILVPKEIPADTYRIKFRVTYNINPLKGNIVQEFESQPVVVDESNVDPDANSVIPESILKQLNQ